MKGSKKCKGKKISLSSFVKCFFVCVCRVDSPKSSVFILKVSQGQSYEEEVGSGYEEKRVPCK